jgi:mannitol/fructose-specific phosphotransferase system IIA component (Ntr-type)
MVSRDLILVDLCSRTREALFDELAENLARRGAIAAGTDLAERLNARERLGPTGLGGGLAIPHCKLPQLAESVVAIAVCPEGIDFGSSDGRPVRVVLVVVSPEGSPADHLATLARVSRIARRPGFVESVIVARTPEAISAVIEEAGASKGSS